MTVLDQDFLQDIEKEKAFLERVVKFEVAEVKGNSTGVTNELALLIKVYNEQLEHLVGLRIDSEIHSYLTIAEPMEKAHLDNKRKTDRGLTLKRKAIGLIRDQITNLLDILKPYGK